MALKVRSLSLNLPFGLGGVALDVSRADAAAAWALFIEFATRVTAYPLQPGGSVQEALESLYSLFATTRTVLREAGPDVGRGPNALGPLAITVLNEGVRPFLVAWRTELRSSGLDGTAELNAERRAAFDLDLDQLRRSLEQYVDALGRIAGVHSESRR